jgi:hypothetical protein
VDLILHLANSLIVQNSWDHPTDSHDLVDLHSQHIHNAYLVNSALNKSQGHGSHDQRLDLVVVESSDLGDGVEGEVSVVLGEGEDELQERHDPDFFLEGSEVVVQSDLGIRDTGKFYRSGDVLFVFLVRGLVLVDVTGVENADEVVEPLRGGSLKGFEDGLLELKVT